MPNAHTVLSCVTTYTCPVPADKPAVANDVTVFPLFQISLPVSGFNAYNTAGADRVPPDSAKTTPLMIIAGRGEISSRDTQDCSSAGAFPCVILKAAIA